MNFNNEVTEIPFVQFLLPNVHEVPKGEVLRKKPIVATKLLKFKGVRGEKKRLWQPSCRNSREREKKRDEKKKNCGKPNMRGKNKNKKSGTFFFFLRNGYLLIKLTRKWEITQYKR